MPRQASQLYTCFLPCQVSAGSDCECVCVCVQSSEKGTQSAARLSPLLLTQSSSLFFFFLSSSASSSSLPLFKMTSVMVRHCMDGKTSTQSDAFHIMQYYAMLCVSCCNAVSFSLCVIACACVLLVSVCVADGCTRQSEGLAIA